MASTKSAMRLPRLVHGSGGGGRKFVALLIAAILVVLVINDPVGAAGFVSTVMDGLTTFFRSLRA